MSIVRGEDTATLSIAFLSSFILKADCLNGELTSGNNKIR